MSQILDNVDKRTKIAGQNRIEILLFRFDNGQSYGLNVFKVKEVIRYEKINNVVHENDAVLGMLNNRGVLNPVIDLERAIGFEPVKNIEKSFIIVTEFNSRTQCFLVPHVDRIINIEWHDIVAPPAGMENEVYITGVTQFDDQLVSILDVERVIQDIMPVSSEISSKVKNKVDPNFSHKQILVVDDSSLARMQVSSVLGSLQLNAVTKNNGAEAWDFITELYESDVLDETIQGIISDIEMPELDGYTFTKKIKEDERFKHLPIILHTSLSGVYNENLVKTIGCDFFIPKFKPDLLSDAVLRMLTCYIE